MILQPQFVMPGQVSSFSGGDWWLAGGVSEADVVSAYTPCEAASFAESIESQVNPGVSQILGGINSPYTLPTLDPGVGWAFSRSAKTRLDSGLPLSNDMAVVVKFEDAFSAGQMGTFDVVGVNITYAGEYHLGYSAQFDYYGSLTQGFYLGSSRRILMESPLPSGVVVLTNDLSAGHSRAYVDGELIASTVTPKSRNTNLFIGGVRGNDDSDRDDLGMNGHISHIAFYNRGLTEFEIAELTSALQAL